MKTAFFTFAVVATTLFGVASPAHAGRPGKLAAIPDFTKGDTVPKEFTHDWNLGPTGLRGWMYSDRLVTSDARQILVTSVAKGSPADGTLAVGDVILGVGGKAFDTDPRTEMGQAITAAESEKAAGKLVLMRWRGGKQEDVTVTLPVLGSYSATAPYDCPKSRRILELGAKSLATRMASSGYVSHLDPIPRSLNALAILASGNPEYLPLVKREAEWAAGDSPGGYKTWYYGYVMIFLAEYIKATGDESVLPGLRRIALEAAHGQSAVGSWGHTFARPDGRLKGYGMMNSPGVPLTIGMVLARDAGVNDPEVSQAIDKSVRLLRFYRGKGAVPYGDHAPWTQTHDDNGKCGMAAILFQRLGDREGAEFFTRMAVASHGAERDCGHTGNYFNILWALPAIAQAGPRATGAWMHEFGGRYYDLARRPDGSFGHQGPPEPRSDSYGNWDATGGCLLAYALPLKKIALTGRDGSIVPPMTTAVADGLLDDGRGWTNKDRTSFYDALDDAEILRRLGSWSPTVRERAAETLGRRKAAVVPDLIAMLATPSVDARLGACEAIKNLRGAAATAVPALRETLKHPDLWLRVQAAEALAAIGPAAKPALPDLLERIAAGPTKDDPRGMEQRFMSLVVFGKMLGGQAPLDGVDRDQLMEAITKGLHNEDGNARSAVSASYAHLSFEDVKPLLPAILDAIRKPAPSGEMFADGVRINGLRLLASHHVEEGMAECATYLQSQNPWASQIRTPEILTILEAYGANAAAVVPQLREAMADFEDGEPDFPKHLSVQKAEAVRVTIAKIEASKDRPPLRHIR
jgi:hypothetical protein